MSEREGPNWPAEGQPVAAEVSERIRSILADAEGAADALRHQAEQEAHARVRAAETEALKIVEEARREAERFLTDRIARVSQLSDEILERGQSVVERLDEADTVRAELAGLVRSLGETAARLANEVRAMPGPKSPEVASAPPPSAAAPSAPAPAERREWAEPDPPAVASPELTDADPEPGRTLAPPEAGFEPGPEPEAPTPGPIEPNAISLAEPEAPADVPEPTPEEIELLERVRAAEAEREREEAEAEGNGPSSEVVELRPSEPEPEPEPVVEAEPEVIDDTPPAAADGDSDGASGDQALGARLVALQMAVAGGNRGEVEAHLRRAFDLDEPGMILDDIFGSGTGADKRVAWPEAG